MPLDAEPPRNTGALVWASDVGGPFLYPCRPDTARAVVDAHDRCGTQGLPVDGVPRSRPRASSTGDRAITSRISPTTGRWCSDRGAVTASSTTRTCGIVALLNQRFSPQQVAAELQILFPEQSEMHVSHETIYQALYVQDKGALRHELTIVKALRSGRTSRGPRSKLPRQRTSLARRYPVIKPGTVPSSSVKRQGP